MKVIIDIPDDDFEFNMNCCPDLTDLMVIYNAIRKGKSLPDNATNGDIIKALFPNATIEIMKSNVEKTMVCVTWNFKDIPSYYNRFYEAWWNAPYTKAESEG